MESEGDAFTNTKVNVRVIGAKRRSRMVNIKANMIGKFIQVRGTVIRISNVQPLVLSVPYICQTCLEPVIVHAEDGHLEPPRACPAQGCRGKTFEPNKEEAVTLDLQYVK